MTPPDHLQVRRWDGAPWTPRAWQREALPIVWDAIHAGQRAVVSAIMGAGKSILQIELVAMRLQLLAEDEVIVVGVPRQKLVRQLGETARARLGDEAVGLYFTHAKEAHRRVIVCCYASAVTLARVLTEQRRRVALFVGDEVHQTEADVVKMAYEALAPEQAVGFTATPFRADRRETLSLWDEIAYRYSIVDALRDGVLVPWVVQNWDGRGDADDIDGICARMIEEHGDGPGIVSSRSIEDAEAYAAYLTDHGIPAEAIHSDLPYREQDARLERLRTGELRCLVHVSLLAEGVDLPWLRWLCMRRKVGSRVRFAQEVGRVLRVYPGKDRAVIMDPYDLFGLHGLHHQEALGEALADAEPGEERQEREEGSGDREPAPPAVAVDALTRWARDAALALEVAGLPGRPRFPAGRWHDERPSPKQVELIGRYQWALAYLPREVRAPLKQLTAPAVVPHLNRLAASELLTLLFMLVDAWKAAKKADRRLQLPPADIPPFPMHAVPALHQQETT